MARKFSHRKKRNSALLYEFLIGYISKCLVNNEQTKAAVALDISKRYFAKNSPLHEELSLFKNVFDTKVESYFSAQKIVDTICTSAARSNSRNLDTAKSKLIKEINHTLADPDFYNQKVNNYTVFASVQTLLNESRNKKKNLTDIEKIQLEETVCNYLVSDDDDDTGLIEENLKVDPNYDNSVYYFVVKRFHEKYANKLNESQRNILNKYIHYIVSNDDKDIKSILLAESRKIKKQLLSVKDVELQEDMSLMSDLRECYKKFASIDIDVINEETLLEVMKYMQLVEEIES